MSHLPSEAVHILLFHPQLDGIVGWNNGVPKGGGGSRNLFAGLAFALIFCCMFADDGFDVDRVIVLSHDKSL